MRKTKIICTLGPASDTPEAILALIENGMDCARLNFSHGDHESHRRTYDRVREAAAKAGRPVAILQDLQGPKIRVGRLAGGSRALEEGARITLVSGAVEATGDEVPVDYPGLAGDLRVGDPIRLDDGLLGLEVEAIEGDRVVARVVDGGLLKDRKGVNLPGSAVSLPSLTDKDKADLELGLELGVDFVALSFVRGPEDLEAVRPYLGDPAEGGTPLIAKLERPQAVDCLDEVIAAADGLMVARGDLGVELPLERVPIIQKLAIEKINACGKLVITATQMLESMTRSSRPTRAEVSDVANSVYDGTDAVMLSGETASGEHPIEAVRTMSKIVREVEASERFRQGHARSFMTSLPTFQNAAARAAVQAASDLGIGTIVAFTESGRSAELISEYRPEARILAFSPVARTLQRMALTWGVVPMHCRRFDSTDAMFGAVETDLLSRGLCQSGDAIILVAGVPPNQRQSTNLVKLHRVG
ncbi:MAG: pyruvate kinase [Deltaproteobacteria bacterium]|nr:pyruvate kinase [Deltaproteobacteria bacterium]